MTRPVVGHADPERLVIEFLDAALGARGETATVGRSLPDRWTPTSGSHVAVAWDGTPSNRGVVLFRASVRVTCWASGASEAKRLAVLCQALLMAGPVGPGAGACQLLAGVLPTRDPDNGGDTAYFTVRVNLRGRVL